MSLKCGWLNNIFEKAEAFYSSYEYIYLHVHLKLTSQLIKIY